MAIYIDSTNMTEEQKYLLHTMALLSAKQKEEKMQKAYLYSADYLNSKLSRQGMINARNRFYKSGAFKSKHGTNLAF